MRVLTISLFVSLFAASFAVAAGPYAPAAGQPGSTAIAAGSPLFKGWATGTTNLVRGPQNITSPGGPFATFGTAANALGPANATTGVTTPVVSLGDGGQITLTFAAPITDDPGYDFAVFENGFQFDFLELGFVEVSSNGADFVRFPSVSLTQTDTQVASTLDPTNLNNLAGKYEAAFGTPFDLAELTGLSPLVDLHNINFVRIVDVVGTIGAGARFDSAGHKINDPYPTAFASGGFDLDAVGVLHQVPEPAGWLLAAIGAAAIVNGRCRRALTRRGARVSNRGQ